MGCDMLEKTDRRGFLARCGGAMAAGALGAGSPWSAAAAAAGSGPGRQTRPKIGCVSWCFHSFAGGTNPEAALDTIGQIGFEGVELIVLAGEDLKTYWTPATVDRLRGQLERHKLVVSQFVLFQPVVEDLSSLDAEQRRRSLDAFEAGCRLGARLGAPIVNIVAPWPRQFGRGQGYIPRYYEMPDAKPGEKFHINIAPGFDWPQVWEQYIETTRACLERAKAHGLKMTIEHHTHTLIPDTTAFLRLWDAIRDPALGLNLDVGWTLLQREYPPLAIHKAGRHLMNVHIRDIDGAMRRFVHVGQGVMDFQAIAQALRAVGFTGFCSIEQDKYPGDMEGTCRRYLAMMRELL